MSSIGLPEPIKAAPVIRSPAETLVTVNCGHKFTLEELEKQMETAGKTDKAGKRYIYCNTCIAPIFEHVYKRPIAEKDEIVFLTSSDLLEEVDDGKDFLSAPGEQNPMAAISRYANQAAILTNRVTIMARVVDKLLHETKTLTGCVDNLGFLCGVQTIRLHNVISMTFWDVIRTYLPRFLGGLSMDEIANRRLSEAQLIKLSLVASVTEKFVDAVLIAGTKPPSNPPVIGTSKQ